MLENIKLNKNRAHNIEFLISLAEIFMDNEKNLKKENIKTAKNVSLNLF